MQPRQLQREQKSRERNAFCNVSSNRVREVGYEENWPESVVIQFLGAISCKKKIHNQKNYIQYSAAGLRALSFVKGGQLIPWNENSFNAGFGNDRQSNAPTAGSISRHGQRNS
jgi:hypothetical protein